LYRSGLLADFYVYYLLIDLRSFFHLNLPLIILLFDRWIEIVQDKTEPHLRRRASDAR
jgi:hypothetical protein